MKSSSCAVASQIDEANWALSLEIGNELKENNKNQVALHYVVDNSGSMGRMTMEVRDIFSEMVDSVATLPCSMTVFNESAGILSADITTGQQMRSLALPRQGRTNIPAGIEKALRVIYEQEMKFRDRRNKGKSDDNIHHILILLSDGEHNVGPSPDRVFPKLKGNILPDDVDLSVVVVGYSQYSNTSMGMLLKKSIETVSLNTETVQTIYFAKSRSALQSTLSSLENGLNLALKGSFHDIEAKDNILIDNFQTGASSKLRVHLASGASRCSLLCSTNKPPESLFIDKMEIEVSTKENVSVVDLSKLIQNLIDKTKVQIVANKDGGATIAKASAKKLEALVKVLEEQKTDTSSFKLDAATPKDRIRHFRTINATCHEARVLRNQVIDMANFSNEGSEKAADYLNGRTMKYANKALRRAAKANDGMIVDPKTERKLMLKDLTSASFRDELRMAMQMDVLETLVNLSYFQFKHELLPYVNNINVADCKALLPIQKQKDVKQILQNLSPRASKMLTSGTLSQYLNEVFHGNRTSYVSLSSPWQHLEEWGQFEEQNFESTWEMLMYAGFVGYPIVLEHSSASQMNPYLTRVKKIHTSLADTASICCASQAQIPVYGPEAGEPVQDILVLVDPSMPRASKMVLSHKLLREKYTSGVVARDLQMYTGFSMQTALHANTMFHLLSSVPNDNGVQRNDIIANLRRQFLGRAFMCGSCGFGPVDHYACGDLAAHQGESSGRRARVNNACPRCGWFSSSLNDWAEWDGEVCEEFIADTITDKSKREARNLSEANIHLVLRIFYSFRKMASESVKGTYAELVQRMASSDDTKLDLSPKSGIDGMSQVLLAILAGPHDDDLSKVLGSDDCLSSIIQEACAREIRVKFRMRSGGDKEKAKEIAHTFVKDLLGVNEDSAPYTLPLMEAEPPIKNVRLDCDDSFVINSKLAQVQVNWVRRIARQWCRVWSFARRLSEVVNSREGGWDQIERDMESSLSSYQDVVDSLKETPMEKPQEMLRMDALEAESLFLRMAVNGIFSNVIEKPCKSDAVVEDEAILHEAAREMRMCVYFSRVQEKMAQWRDTGEDRIYFVARAADIAQFSGMIGHAHSLDKQTFWGLWKAAKNSKNAEKVAVFLATANTEFSYKHYDSRTLARTENDWS